MESTKAGKILMLLFEVTARWLDTIVIHDDDIFYIALVFDDQHLAQKNTFGVKQHFDHGV